MRFRIEHTFANVSVADYETLYFDEPFNTALCQDVKLARRLLERALTDGRLRRVATIGPQRELPRAVSKIIGSDRIEYTEHIDYQWGKYQGTWKTISSVLSDKVDCKGTFVFNQRNGGVMRVVEGEIAVKVFGIGGVVEKLIVSDIEQSYEKAATFTQRWIDAGRPMGSA